MLFELAMVVAIASTVIEIKLVNAWPALHSLYNSGRKGVWINVFCSFLLSWAIGTAFGAEGVTVFIGGLASTFLSQQYFAVEKFCKAQGWTWIGFKTKAIAAPQKLNNARVQTIQVYRNFKGPLIQTFKVIRAIIMFITWPFRFANRMAAAYTEAHGS